MQAEAKVLPVEVVEVRTRIEAWRKVRRSGSKMPEDLWFEAVSLAKDLGINPVSSALGLSYTRLRKRLEKGTSGKPVPSMPEFVELEGGQLLSRSALYRSEKKAMSEVVIEVSSGDGSCLSIRMGAGSEVDVAALVRAFQG
jgi:hypothetical protein